MTVKAQQDFLDAIKTKGGRVAIARESFRFFFSYYFQKDIHYTKFAPYHVERFKAIKNSDKIFAKGMRGVAKTTILGIANIVYHIVFKDVSFVALLCYDQTKARGLSTLIRNELARNTNIINDFGTQYKHTGEKKDDGFDSKTISEFVTVNGTKIKGFSMGTAIRGEIYNHPKHGKVRPDFLLIDDIDTNKNTKNKRMIADDMEFIYSECIGGMSQDSKNRVVWLGNVIRQDGRNVRQEEIAKSSGRTVFDNFLYGKAGQVDGIFTRDRYVQNKEEETKTKRGHTVSVERLREDRKEGFNQNALGVPLIQGDCLYDSSLTQYFHEIPQLIKIYIGIDPAFSLKTGSDGVGIVVGGYTGYGKEKTRYILKAFALYDKHKDEDNILRVVKELYHTYGVTRAKVENNNGGGIIERILSKNYMATEIISTTKDKATRFLEIKGLFLNKQVYFHNTQCEPLITQLEQFTGEDGGFDDIVDAMIGCIGGNSSKGTFL